MAFEKVFDQKGTFEALHAAQRWLRERGYSYGSTCACYPVGVLHGDYLIAKWRNLTRQERAELDGALDGDFREGPLTLRLKRAPQHPNTEGIGDE